MSDDKLGFPKHKQYSEPWNKKLTHIAQEKRKKEKEGTRGPHCTPAAKANIIALQNYSS
jgi:hypothetical protein